MRATRNPWAGAAAGLLALCGDWSAAHAGPPSALERRAIAAVAVAEAGDQGDEGLAGVVFVILNRLRTWGGTVESVLNAPRQFEPVWRAGGSWRALPKPSATQQRRIDAILTLALAGDLPDLTGGALYFQNPTLVARRIAVGSAPPDRLDFSGRPMTTRIGAHAFYRGRSRSGSASPRGPGSRSVRPHGIFLSMETAGAAASVEVFER